MSIEVRGLRKTFGQFVALDNVDLDVPGGELVASFGLLLLINILQWAARRRTAT